MLGLLGYRVQRARVHLNRKPERNRKPGEHLHPVAVRRSSGPQGHGSHWPTHSTHQEVKLACQAQHLRGRKSACKRGVGKGLTDAYRRRWRVAAVCSGVGYFMASGKCSLRGAEGEAVCSMPEGWEGHLAGLASRISCSHMWPLHMHDVGRPEHVRPQRCKPTRPPCSTPRSTW